MGAKLNNHFLCKQYQWNRYDEYNCRIDLIFFLNIYILDSTVSVAAISCETTANPHGNLQHNNCFPVQIYPYKNTNVKVAKLSSIVAQINIELLCEPETKTQ